MPMAWIGETERVCRLLCVYKCSDDYPMLDLHKTNDIKLAARRVSLVGQRDSVFNVKLMVSILHVMLPDKAPVETA